MDKLIEAHCNELERIGCQLDREAFRQSDEIVSVTVLIFPDGGSHWFKTKPVFKNKPNENVQYIRRCVEIWNERNRLKYDGFGDFDLMGAVANVRMFKKDFDKLPITDDFI